MSELIAGSEEVMEEDHGAFRLQSCWRTASDVFNSKYLVVDRDVDRGIFVAQHIRHCAENRGRVTSRERAREVAYLCSCVQRTPWMLDVHS